MSGGAPSCPVPGEPRDVLMAHGGGGRLTQRLLERVFLPAFDSEPLRARHDGAVLELGEVKLAFSTDGYVVSPLFFPGGDLGTLAVCGTVNDLAMCGARPRWLSAAFILEEGLPLETLERIVGSMREAAAQAGVEVVTGDTKVVDRGKGDGVFVTTAGVGEVLAARPVLPASVRAGDAILLSGDVGRHGVAILLQREDLGFEVEISSDCALVHEPVLALLEAGLDVHCLRDLTRGGLTSALCEVAAGAGHTVRIDEAAVPVGDGVRSVCEVLGLDPFHVANEGRFVCLLPVYWSSVNVTVKG